MISLGLSLGLSRSTGTPPPPPPPPSSGIKAVAQGLTGSGAVAMPAEAATGDTIIYVATRDPAAPGTITAPAGGTVANGAGGGNSTELLVWVDADWNGTDVPGNFGDSGSFSERLIYVFDGTASSTTLGTETGSAPGPAPTWGAVTAPGAGAVIALASTYDFSDAPYTRADTSYTTDAAQGNWVGVTGMSKAITAGGSQSPNPVGNFAGTGNMTTLMIAIET